MSHSSSLYRPDIDGLRAVAVLSVVAFHAFPATLASGFIGVDIFFVLSGYLIGGIILRDLQAGTFTFWNFYSRRIRRIFPALITVMLAALIFGWFALFPGEYKALGKHIFGGASFSSNFVLWNEAGYFDTAAKAKPLLHLWSLGIEEQFYILFPLLLWCCAKRHWRIATVLLLCAILSLLGNLFLVHTGRNTADFYSPFSRFWELLSGAALVAVQGKMGYQRLFLHLDRLCGGGGQRASLFLALGGAFLITIALVLIRESNPYPSCWALLPVLGTVLLLAAGQQNPLNTVILGNPVAAFLGRISYPLYLWHWVLLSFAYIINGGFDENTRLLRLGLVALSFVLAILTYLFVERPLRFGKGWPQGKVFALMGVMVALGSLGLLLYRQDGAKQRAWVAREEKQEIQFTFHTVEHFILHAAKQDACWQYTQQEPDSLSPCLYNDVGASETVAIIGDSHAYFAYDGLAKLGEELHYNIVNLGWIVPGAEKWAPARMPLVSRILSILTEKKDIQKVFLCTRGMAYINGKHNFLPGMNVEEDASPESIVGIELYAKSLQNYVNTLRNAGKEVYIIAENPELPDYPHKFRKRPFKFQNKPFPTVYKRDQLNRQAPYLKLLAGIKGATIIPVLDTFCPGETCMVYNDEGISLYFDDDHLSGDAGGDFLAQKILRPYLERKKDGQ